MGREEETWREHGRRRRRRKDAAVQRKKGGLHKVIQGIKTKYNSMQSKCFLLQATLGSLLPNLAPKVSRFFDGGAVPVLPAPALAVPPTLLPGLANMPMLSAPGRCPVLNQFCSAN